MPTAADADIYRPEKTPSSSVLLGISYGTTRDLVDRAREGLPVDVVERLQELLGVTAADLYDLIRLPQRTLYRRRREGHLQPDESERVLRMARLYEQAEDVLRERERALLWLKTPHRALDGRSPLQYAATELGAREVEDLLGRIAHGVPF